MARQRRRRINWFGWTILTVLLLFGVWQLANLFKLFEFDVVATIKDTQTGGVAGVDGSWSPPFIPSANVSGSGGGSFAVNWQPGGTGSGGTGSGGGETGGEEPGDDYTPPVINSGGGSGGGGTPTLTIINDSILKIEQYTDFGYVFPGQVVTGYFIVSFKDTSYDNTSYKITLSDNLTADYSMKAFIKIEKATEGIETERDEIACGEEVPLGCSGEYIARGDLSTTDTEDKWWVTFYVPDTLGYYLADVYLESPDPD